MTLRILVLATLAIALALPGPAARGSFPEPFVITVADEETGRGVPLVELETVHKLRFVTDSRGVAAFAEPGLMDQTVHFLIRSHGYEFPADGFGIRGKALRVTPGGSARLTIRRKNVAERLYRVTGAGIYRDSLLVGQAAPIANPVLNGQVLGSDSVINVFYRGRLRWFWGDTSRPGYPLGNFHVPGATSLLPADGGLDPDSGVDLAYFLDPSGFAKPTAKMPGNGPTWISGAAVLPDASGRERIYTGYVKIRNMLEAYDRGIAAWDDDGEQFEKVKSLPLDAAIVPDGHPFRHSVGGSEYLYFSQGYPLTRVRADAEHYLDTGTYEAFTPLVPGGRLDDPRLDREADGTLRYGWKADTPAVGVKEQADWIEEGLIRPDEGLLQLRDVETGKPVAAHNGAVAWNENRRRWVLIVTQFFGTSVLGEVWYAEADTPVGPWAFARKVLTHDRYSFYNPKQHPYFAEEGGRVLFFEGTYTASFSGNDDPTPLYDYNQIMYKLDLADPRLNLPAPAYVASAGPVPDRFATRLPGHSVAFFALERPDDRTLPVFERAEPDGRASLQVGGDPPDGPDCRPDSPRFFALPAELESPPEATTPLFAFVRPADQARAYATDPAWTAPGFESPGRPIARVWINPSSILLPAD